MSDTTSSPRALPGAPFATIPAAQLRVGDLIHRVNAADGRDGYVLVARTAYVDDLVHLMLYDSTFPLGRPATCRPDERVMLACRDLIEPDDGLTAWTDARWRRAHRRGAAMALIDQIRARSVGLPPVVVAPGESIEDEIDRIRGRDQLPPRVLPAEEITGLLVDGPPDRLDLDVADPAVRAILTLLGRVKAVEEPDGSWDGGDVVAILAEWFDTLGLRPEQAVADLTGRVVTSGRSPSRVASKWAAWAAADGPQRSDGFAEVDLDRVADLVRAGGVDCEIDTPGGGVAVLLAGRPTSEPAWAFPWAVQVGPGRFCWDAPSTASLRDLRIGPDTPDLTRTMLLRELGATSENQIAAAVLTHARLTATSDRPDGAAG